MRHDQDDFTLEDLDLQVSSDEEAAIKEIINVLCDDSNESTRPVQITDQDQLNAFVLKQEVGAGEGAPAEPMAEPEVVATAQPAPGNAPVEPGALTRGLEAVSALDDQQHRADRPQGLDVSLAPGCYGMSMCYREDQTIAGQDGSTYPNPCLTCPFTSTCKPLAEESAAMLVGRKSVADVQREQDKIWRRNDRTKKKTAAALVPTPTPAPVVKAAPPSSLSKAMLDALQKAIENRHSTDRRLEKMTDPQKQKEYVAVAIIAWWKPELSAAKIAELYNAKTGKTGKDGMDKKKVENRMARVKTLVDTGIWKPFQSGARL